MGLFYASFTCHMITDKKPSIDEIKAIFGRVLSLVVEKWQKFQNTEHSTKEWVFIFVLAMIFGMAGKVVAIKTFTIGYEDYLVPKVTSPVSTGVASSIARGPICEE